MDYSQFQNYCRQNGLGEPKYSRLGSSYLGKQVSITILGRTFVGEGVTYVDAQRDATSKVIKSIESEEKRCESKVSLLNDLVSKFQSAEPECGMSVRYEYHGFSGTRHRFTCIVTINGEVKSFTGEGLSKPNAKLMSASKAFVWLKEYLQSSVEVLCDFPYCKYWSDDIAKCKALIKQVCHNQLEPFHRDDVVAAMIMFDSYSKTKIVAIGSGKGFMHGRYVTKDGSVLQDCHAEVLAKRGLQAFLLREMKKQRSSVVQKYSSGRYDLKDGVSFHLYVNKVPCGDAMVPSGSNDSYLRCRKEGSDAGPGLLKGYSYSYQELKEGYPAYKMCCSDKIALWNVAGLQGALLSHLLCKPIYLNTIVVEGLAEENNLRRAFFERFKGISGLPRDYTLNEPSIVVINGHSNVGGGHGGDKKAFTWVAGADDPGGMIDTQTGRVEAGSAVITKASLFQQWKAVAPFSCLQYGNYQKCKKGALEYRKAIGAFCDHCERRNMGKWIARTREVDQFN